MNLILAQRVSVRYSLDEYAAWKRHFIHPAEHYQPILGLAFVTGSLVWATFAATSIMGMLACSFIMFWGVFLAVRRPFLDTVKYARIVWKHRGKWGYDQQLRFFEEGYSITDEVDTVRVSWSDIRNVFSSAFGITILENRNVAFFISVRAEPASAYEELLHFTARKFDGKYISTATSKCT